MLTLLERSLQRESLSSNFSTTEELLGATNMRMSSVEGSTDLESVPVLPWLPQTTAALALRLLEFDASISYAQLEKHGPYETKETKEFIKLPSRYASTKIETEAEQAFIHDEYIQGNDTPGFVSGENTHKRGRHKQGRGKTHSKKTQDSRGSDISFRNSKGNDNFNQGLSSSGQSGGRGRRTVRKRREEKRVVEDLLPGQRMASPVSDAQAEPMDNLAEDWDADDNAVSVGTPIQLGDNCDSAEEVYSDENGAAVEYGQGNWEIGFNGASSGWGRGLMEESSDEDMDASEDYNGVDNGVEVDSDADVMSEDSDEMANRGGNEDGSDSSAMS